MIVVVKMRFVPVGCEGCGRILSQLLIHNDIALLPNGRLIG